MNTPTKIVIAASVAVIGGIALVGTSMARGGFHQGHGPFGGGFGGGGAGMLVEQFDTNQDQRLTTAEIDEGIRSRLANADSNGDGSLSLEEFQPLLVEIMRPKIVDGFQFLDADGDAVITPDEIQRPVNRIVSHLDRNDDGELTSDEMMRRHRGWGRGHHGYDNDDDDDDDS